MIRSLPGEDTEVPVCLCVLCVCNAAIAPHVSIHVVVFCLCRCGGIYKYAEGRYKCVASNDMKPSDYEWRTGVWSTCSKSCGGGLQYRTVLCVHKTNNSTAVSKALVVLHIVQYNSKK